ncbi:LysR family transcriptional regulator [Francisella tularensis]|uniref:LysR transcriptional regulator family domain protein n=1 Tax=Francisella tularensis subsp. holarctica (strain LVS) TaxID=376619 RepID=A0AAI8FT69_FRATH|nr:LysR family transcriptional regulator [Francisella tularensis subsp. holarctica F92]AJI52024.1 lysR transcriptional regulator family domain protein [Francisella tularensis subsp. holarctica]AJI58514.1 lysR transcriptional regulator family domain protein [Francisella tularensis subsp. holarctica LVS]ALK93851.1 LysR family transcriptional regulator [Francisella tularensis]AJI65505.1 lysR transcriptional regulator family domain protein [Francisella tularensis subsp. holarctica]
MLSMISTWQLSVIEFINVLDIFANDKADIEPVLNEYYFGKTSFYLVRATGVRSNLEREFVKFIDVCLQDKSF